MHSKGFTLIECVMTLILLGILAVISVSVISIFKYKSEQSVLMQTDLISASNCIERIKAIADTGEFVKNRNNLACSNASIVVQALKPISENSVPDNGVIRIIPASDSDNAPYYLATVKSGSIEFNYVVSGEKN